MSGRWLCLAVLTVTLLPVTPARAQSAGAGPQAPKAAAPVRADVDKLPVSLARIRRELARTPVKEEERFENFRLLTFQTVYGQAPRFELLTPDEELEIGGYGAVRYGGVTHQEFLQQVAPRNFRAPVTNMGGNVLSLFTTAAEKRREARRKKEDEERRRKSAAVQER